MFGRQFEYTKPNQPTNQQNILSQSLPSQLNF